MITPAREIKEYFYGSLGSGRIRLGTLAPRHSTTCIAGTCRLEVGTRGWIPWASVVTPKPMGFGMPMDVRLVSLMASVYLLVIRWQTGA